LTKLGRPECRIVGGKLAGAPFMKNARLQRVLSLLNADGEEARAIGGAVRNALLGEKIADVDVTTTALPDVVCQRAKAAGIRVIPTGIDHGTVTLLVEGEAFEVTTLREDVETDGRRAVVRFGRDFEADALRRDFTMNALSVDADGTVHDYCGGLEDIGLRRVRFIGDPAQRIREDYLRILRLFRFHAAYGVGGLEADARDAAIALRGGLEQLSRERVRTELLKLLVARGAADAVVEMQDAGILTSLLHGVASPQRLNRLAQIETCEQIAPDVVMRLMALAVETREDAARLRDRLRLSNNEETRIAQAMSAVDAIRAIPRRRGAPTPAELYRLLFLFGRRAALDGTTYVHAASRDTVDDARWRSARLFLTDTPEPRLPFTGADLVQRGLRAGPAIGAILKHLQASWIRAGFPREPDVLARLLDESLAAHGSHSSSQPGR
jgi:poly(A) polymerase